MDLLSLLGKIVRYQPNFVKNWLEKLVFLNTQNNLPKSEARHLADHCNVALVLGGCTGRPERALELYKEGIVDKILVSGGIGPHSDSFNTEGGTVSEAEVYSRFLLKNGVSPLDIRAEINSVTTSENVEFSLPILARQAEEYDTLNVVIVTNHFHLKRSIRLFQKACMKLKKTNPSIAKLKIYWAAADYHVTRQNWRQTEDGNALIGKEAIRLIQLKIFGRG